MKPSDKELLGRVSCRDAEAFDSLFARHAGAVRDRLARIVRSESAAEDLLQEVFLRVWIRADQWAGHGSVRAWLLGIAAHLALNHLRSSRRRRHRPLEAPPAGGGDEEEDLIPGWMIDASAVAAPDAAELAERAETLRRLLGELPEEKREVLEMIYQEQLDIREAAERLGVPPGTIKSRLHYARQMIRQGWPDQGPD